MNTQPGKRANKMKYPEELNLQKEMDCGTGAERARHTRGEKKEGEAEWELKLRFVDCKRRPFLDPPARTHLNPSRSPWSRYHSISDK